MTKFRIRMEEKGQLRDFEPMSRVYREWSEKIVAIDKWLQS